MIMAGGQGSRLYVLTSKIAKPAVPFGGKYRIIDYTISNCVNSRIDTVGVLTQYQPLLLNEYIGNGQPWDLDRLEGGVTILPPYQKNTAYDWYTGNANAVFQNMHYIQRFDPEHVLVLGGDHIYRMDYSEMINYHKAKDADCTISVIDVPLEEAGRYGIMNTEPDGSIYEFEEKPEVPKSTKASMGIYVFKWSKLKKFLIADNEDPNSAKDFGKNIITGMLASGERMFAYSFKGYWRDVGTIESLWQANMDLLDPDSGAAGRGDWTIYTRTEGKPPQYIGETGKVTNSIVSEGCEIYGTIEHSIIFPGVVVHKGTFIKDSIIMANSVIKAGANIKYSIIDEGVTVGKKAKIGGERGDVSGIAVLAKSINIGDGAAIAAGEMVDADVG
ncbi:MAG: glucose-1-phosphate adenylyltransferase [Oscillospiraceae bacterium]|nr:glucose-1-phosphate adenylyltransferase [Oscillospiraceae bacterium]